MCTFAKSLWSRGPSSNPFEFGDIRQRERPSARAWLKKKHGQPLSASSTLPNVLCVQGTAVDGIQIAAAAFRDIRTGFNAASALFRPGRLCGFLTDLPRPNGLAWQLHTGENCYGIAVTAGTFFHTLVSAHQILCRPALEQHIPLEGTWKASSPWLDLASFPMPASKARRDLAVRYASYGLYAVFLHELAHVFRGHLTFLFPTGGVPCLDELSPPPDPNKAQLYLETDADEVAGAMLAKLAFKPYLNGTLLEDPAGRQAAFDAMVGVTLTLSRFDAEKNRYHGGALRTYVLMSALMNACHVDRRTAAVWLEQRISVIQQFMVEAKIIDVSQVQNIVQEAQVLLHSTLPAMRQLQPEWLAHRPFRDAAAKATAP